MLSCNKATKQLTNGSCIMLRLPSFRTKIFARLGPKWPANLAQDCACRFFVRKPEIHASLDRALRTSGHPLRRWMLYAIAPAPLGCWRIYLSCVNLPPALSAVLPACKRPCLPPGSANDAPPTPYICLQKQPSGRIYALAKQLLCQPPPSRRQCAPRIWVGPAAMNRADLTCA